MTIRIAFLALLLLVAAACREPAGGGSPSPSDQPERPSAPAAPATETDLLDAEETLRLPDKPSLGPPAIETDHPEAE